MDSFAEGNATQISAWFSSESDIPIAHNLHEYIEIADWTNKNKPVVYI